jgi:hypothetical protein
MKGTVTDPQGNGVSGASIQLLAQSVMISETVSGPDGSFVIKAAENAVRGRKYVLKVAAAGFQSITKPITGRPDDGTDIELRLNKLSAQHTNVTVTADVNDLHVLSTNGYADPNIFIPEILESVEVNGGAYNVLQGNHSLNLAAIYGLRSHLDPFAALTADYRDLDLVLGVSPTPLSFLAIEASYGNGFLKRLEHRQQYKLNTQHIFEIGAHRFT